MKMGVMMSTQDDIKKTITENKVVLFMKGTPDFPQCGFSSKVVQMLRACHADFKAVNVLADDAIRQGIKEYANWPTIPQLYIDGEFVGGCDIATELFESGELQKMIT
jgi:monothiol glutaredoxin